ncbi:MAG: TIGR03000 domain-containing protein [Gemmataceae bacterium]
MFSVVLFAALMAGENTADFHFRSCYGGAHSCYGGCYGSCYGWSSKAYYGGCYGSACHGGCHGGYSGCSGCIGSCYGGCTGSGYGGCSGSGCGGGCWGAPYAGYGSACGGGCFGGCGGFSSPAYGVPSGGCVGMPAGGCIGTPMMGAPVMEGGIPLGAAPAAAGSTELAGGDRAKLIFKMPEGAKLFVEGQLIANAAEQKTFRSPVLDAGKTYTYSLRVEAEKDGEKLVGEKTVNVKAGRTEDVDLTAVELKKETKVAAR